MSKDAIPMLGVLGTLLYQAAEVNLQEEKMKMEKLNRGVTVCFQCFGQFVWMVGKVFEVVWMEVHDGNELWESNCSLSPVFAVLW